MFTGLIEEVGTVRAVRPRGDGIQFDIETRKISSGLKIDNSVAVNGACLTIVRRKKNILTFDAVKETLSKTSLSGLRAGSRVNLERAVSLNQRLGGHLVQGHVDSTGTIMRRTELKASWMFSIRFPKRFRKYLIPVGSVAVDGVSLTVARLHSDYFEVAIIPYTFERTIFRDYQAGSTINLEFDLIGKYHRVAFAREVIRSALSELIERNFYRMNMKDLFKSKMTRIALWCAGGLLFIVLLLDNVILPWYVNHGGTLVVPDVVGMQEADAFRVLDSLNLEPRKGDVHPDKDYPEGYVVAQNPVALQIVKPRRRVYLTISGGEQLAVVPELKGRSLRDTKFALDRSGLKLGGGTV